MFFFEYLKKRSVFYVIFFFDLDIFNYMDTDEDLWSSQMLRIDDIIMK